MFESGMKPKIYVVIFLEILTCGYVKLCTDLAHHHTVDQIDTLYYKVLLEQIETTVSHLMLQVLIKYAYVPICMCIGEGSWYFSGSTVSDLLWF